MGKTNRTRQSRGTRKGGRNLIDEAKALSAFSRPSSQTFCEDNMKILSTILLAILVSSCSPELTQSHRNAEEIVNAPNEFWQIVLYEFFQDGGSGALGLINKNGEIIYVWAEATWHKPGKQKIFLQLNFNDQNRIEIAEGSALEKQVLEILKSAYNRTGYTQTDMLVDKFKKVLNDRTQQITINNWMESNKEITEQGSPLDSK